MKFTESELFGAALIGFDMIDGPFLKWKKEYENASDFVNLDDFAMNFLSCVSWWQRRKKTKGNFVRQFLHSCVP